MATTVYSILDSRDKTELTNKINSDKTELTQSIQSTKTELQGNIDALEEKHDEDKTTLQNNINKKADKTELTSHNTSGTAHNDIRLLIQELTTRLNALADSDDSTLDQMSEIVAYIEDNRDLIESITTSKVSVSDIINNVTTNVANKPLSAAMGVHLKGLIDAIPTDTLSTVNEKIAEHNVSGEAHEDIRTDVLSAMSEATTAKTNAATAQAAADAAQEDVDDALSRLNSLEVGSGKLDRIVGGDGIVTCEDSLVDASPVEMTVYGNTVQNLWVNPVTSSTNNGITVTEDENGAVTISGTATVDTYIVKSDVYSLKPSTEYTVSVDKKFSSWGFYIECVSESGNPAFYFGGTWGYTETTRTFTTPADTTRVVFAIAIESGATVSGTYRVMLNEGSEAELWCPPGLNSVGDDGTVEVVTAGKNLFVASKDAFQVQGEDRKNQVITIGVKAGEIPIGSKVIFSFDYRLSSGSGTVTIQQGVSPYKTLGVSYLVLNGDNTWHKKIGSARTLDIDDMTANTYQLRLDNVTGLLDIKNFQLELGSTATAYEPPNITTTPIDLQGHTLNALPDGTRDELHIDGGGNVVLEKRTGTYTYDGTESFAAVANEYWTGAVSTALRGVDSFNDYVSENRTHCDKLPPVSTDVVKDGTGNGILFVDTDFTRTNNTAAYRLLISSDPEDVKNVMKGGKVLYKLAESQTIYLGTIDLPALPSSNSHIWIADDVSSSLSVRYWLPNGELVADLYESGATDEMSDAEIIAIWNGATGDIVAATNADIDAMFD